MILEPAASESAVSDPTRVPVLAPELAIPPVIAEQRREHRPRGALGARLFSVVALSGVMSGLAYVGAAGYHVAHDSFVAPLILSPDSDLVIQSKLSLARVVAERQTLAARIEQSRSGAEAGKRAIAHLAGLRADASRALDWSRVLTERQAEAGAGTLAHLAAQKAEVMQMTAGQEAYVQEMRKSVEAGLARRTDLAREEKVMGELRVAALQNDRDRLATDLQRQTATLTQDALQARARGGRGMETPEMRAQRSELVRIELESLKIENELAEKVIQRRADEEALAKADELIAQMKARPVFRAIESSQNVAFVPYTQLAGVHAGDDVFACEVWGVFACRPVGRVSELIPGEVATQDPWGTPARGQYALLALAEPIAAQSKTLRIREHVATPAAGDSAPMAGAGSPPAAEAPRGSLSER